MNRELRIRFILERPLVGIDFGIQRGKGKDYGTVEKRRSKGKDLTFEFSLPVQEKGGEPNFTGPFAQGPPSGRFVYIDIGKYAGQKDTNHGARMKVPLSGITLQMVSKLDEDPQSVLEARLPRAATATTPPIEGWKIVRR